jgi:F-type H+-transporting ATPase subunit a
MRLKKRYLVLAIIVLMIIFGSVIAFTKPVLPTIQLPGEVFPGTKGFWPEALFNGAGITNTFVATLITWLLVLLLAFGLRARSRTAEEIPTGFYNLFEMIIEGAYNFAQGIAGPKIKNFFPYFMSFLLIILVANWMELVPGVDSIGVWENKAHFEAEKAADEHAAEVEAETGQPLSEAEHEEFVHTAEEEFAAANLGDLRVGPFLIRADGNADETAPLETNPAGEAVGRNPQAADWTIVPFLRAAATDLNFTLAFALVSVIMTQYYGFKFLGGDYLKKFFPFLERGWGDKVVKNPIKAIDPAVGILELISELSKILSFSFRLLGNIFAGQVLLFVMAFILPVINVAFFGLEFFVGLIQAAVFGLLTLLFMSSATTGHGEGEEHH